MRLRFISWLYISFTIILLFLSSNAWTKSISHSLPEIRVLQTRYGEHDNFSRIVLDLNKRIEYKILKITDESYDVELFGFQRDDIEDYYPAENKHIEKIQYSKSDNKLIAHIIFKKPSYVLKDFRLENTDRIVIDFSDSTRINDVGIVSKTKIDKKDSYVKSENEVDPNTKEKSAIESKVNQIKISSSETDKPIAERFEGNADEINEISRPNKKVTPPHLIPAIIV